MPTQKHINEIADYLRKFKSGELEHKQEWYHCGTAHCLAGWKAVHDAQAIDPTILDEVEQVNDIPNAASDWNYLPGLDEFIRQEINSSSEWEYAEVQWELSEHDALLLFDQDLTIDEMIANLQQIATSYGLTCPSI